MDDDDETDMTVADLAGLLESINCDVPLGVVAGWHPMTSDAAAAWAEAMLYGADDPPERPVAVAPYDCARCRRCGCTGADACPGGCSWAAPDLCSQCAAPTSLRELVAFLQRRPRVLYTGFDGQVAVQTFARSEGSGIWFALGDGREQFLPVNCRMGKAAAHEAGLEFSPDGFALTKFGKTARYAYCRGPNQ